MIDSFADRLKSLDCQAPVLVRCLTLRHAEDAEPKHIIIGGGQDQDMVTGKN